MATRNVTVTIYMPHDEAEAIERDARVAGRSRNQEVLTRMRRGRSQDAPRAPTQADGS